eukprot:NODE_20654_length_788_cov_4.473525.p3 GENE.NODE_20654_length_788_cov_4.473525~~NODE_20654_length_788_cov_4.473525.p3  ORF type:complete len:87 (+),score=37.36 NODE_20654_length_788_cov_4.473525:499-759(+)
MFILQSNGQRRMRILHRLTLTGASMTFNPTLAICRVLSTVRSHPDIIERDRVQLQSNGWLAKKKKKKKKKKPCPLKKKKPNKKKKK